MSAHHKPGGRVSQPPDESSFLRRLIEGQLHSAIGASGKIEFTGEEMRVRIAVPLSTGLVVPPAQREV
jgi:hypothetical protein